MAEIPNGYPGGFCGTLGTAAGASWKGVPVIRSRPPRKRARSTPARLKQMARLALVSEFVHPLTGLLNKTYHSVTERMSCFNKTLSLNLRNAVSGDYPDFRINYPLVQPGMGLLLNPERVTAWSESDGMIQFHWTDNSGTGSARRAW